ncbi:MAG: diguanylate cyclase [Chloracidobacterium sp.]|nr:diguanylate cyclase [Chloracidobacterium sp.]
MNPTDPQPYDLSTGSSPWLSLAAAPLVFGIGYFIPGSPSVNELTLLSISILVAVLLCKYEGRLPFTSAYVSLRNIAVFWGILNLGIAGGLLVSVSSGLARFSDFRGRRAVWAKQTVAELGCALAAGAAYTGVHRLFSSGLVLPETLLVPSEVIWSAAAMLVTYQVSATALFSWYADVCDSKFRLEKAGFGEMALGHFIAGAAALLLFAAFRHFGNAFGLVVVPLAILGNVAFQIHIRRLSQKTKEVLDASRLHLATVEALATAIDARDQVGTGHVRRTQIYAVGIGAALGLDDNGLNAIRAGALLHDIGKLAVPEHILNKPGRLTPAELEKTKVHAVVGASILEKVGFPYPVVPTVRHHHECWDGSGYPDGLSGTDIPITARILAVADTYDALRGSRPYRPAVSREDASNFLRSRAGSQFDPNVVNTFLRHLSNLESEVEILGFGYESESLPAAAGPDGLRGGTTYVEQIKRANQEVFSLYEMARDFGTVLDPDEALALLTKKVGQFVPFETCLVFLLDEDAKTATAVHVAGKNSETLEKMRVTVGEGATGFVLKKKRPVENVDPSLDFAFSHPEICGQYVGMASVPLFAEDKLLGAISVFSGRVGIYEEEHLRLLETIARIAGDAISKSIKHAESESFALTDPLTGLPNSRSLHRQFEKELARAKRSGSTLQLLMLDLDGFKSVNDNLGHKAGDAMLKDIGRIIRSELRDYDFLSRYGGDEFVALVPDMDSADVIELCARIEKAVKTHASSVPGVTGDVGVSVGAASFPSQGETFEVLLIAADKAMYRTKAFHKERSVRLEQGPTRPAEPVAEVRDVYPVEEWQPELSGADPGGELVLELDESHIVTVNTVN